MENYYKVLGVEEKASYNKIKSAYRELSMKHHPDRPGGNEENFKKINEAYETLADEEKRKIYDMQRNHPFSSMSSGMPSEGDIFNLLFAGMGGMPPGIPGMPGGIPVMRGIPGMGGGLFRGRNPHVQIFRNGVPMPSPFQKPTPIVKKITISLEQAYTGCNLPLEIERWVLQENHTKMIEKEKIYVEIPMGIDTNEIIIIVTKRC